MFNHPTSDFAGIPEVLRAALGCQGTLIIILLSTVEAVRVDTSQIQKEQIEVLLFGQEVLSVILDLFEYLLRNLLFWV